METLDIILALAVAFAWYLGYLAGQHITAARITRLLLDDESKIHDMLVQARKTMNQQEQDNPDNTRELDIERHGDQLYIYTKNDKEFLAQGSTLQECLDRIEKRFPGRSFQGVINKEQVDQLGIDVK